MAGFSAVAADFQVKKASNVKKQEQSGLDSVASNSLLPGVVNLVTNVAALKKQTEELKAECAPTSAEITWVNNMVKEYAKVGSTSAEKMVNAVGTNRCGNDTYEYSVLNSVNANLEPCVPTFSESADQNMIWYDYPKAASAKYCPGDDTTMCADAKKKTKSNIYKVFGAIDFLPEDYTESEASTYVKFMEKMEKCAPEKISARNRQAYAEFLKTTITGVGQKQNTATIWESVGNLTGNSGLSGLSNVAGAMTQFLQ